MNRTGLISRFLATVMLCVAAIFGFTLSANAQTKSLKLYYLHTGEKAEITYKRGGKYLPSGLKKINWHLRDWRRNEPTKMDPKLLDLVWEAYRQSGSKAYIHVISGYRSPASNNLLRKRGRGVATKSQHTVGKALDFFLPDVKLSKLREIGLKLGVGGVGYYPKSGSPFVHFDTGRVRHWPRMTRKQLVRVFPKGDTMHVPTDGKPLARYKQAVAAYERKKKSGNLIPEGPATSGGNFFQRLARANRTADEEDDSSNGSAPTPRAVQTTAAPKPETPQFASLPRRVPVPIVAPRGELIDNGAEIAVAAVETQPAPEPVAAEIPDPVRDPETETADALVRDEGIESEELPQDPQDNEFALASLTVPVPARRPELDAVAIQAETPQPGIILADSAEPANPQAALALVDDTPATSSGGTLVAALTPSEIEDLRSRVRSTIGQTTLRAPTPAAEVRVAPKDETVKAAPSATPDSEQPEIRQPVATDTSDIQVAAIEPLPSPEQPSTDIVGIEPGVRSQNVLPVPQPNPVAVAAATDAVAQDETASTQLAAVEAVVASESESDTVITGFAGIELASLPVPRTNPMGTVNRAIAGASETPVVVARLETPVVTPAPSPVSENAPADILPSRTISLDRFSAPQVNSSTIGQFALATTTTIRDLADVRAPAYGRNVIREIPNTILVQGFARQLANPVQNGFSGRAVNALNFPKRRIN